MSVLRLGKFIMKPMKTKAGKPNSSIKQYFKSASNLCVGEKVSTSSDGKAFYVQELKDRLKSYDDKTEKVADKCNTGDTLEPCTVDRKNPNGDGVIKKSRAIRNVGKNAGDRNVQAFEGVGVAQRDSGDGVIKKSRGIRDVGKNAGDRNVQAVEGVGVAQTNSGDGVIKKSRGIRDVGKNVDDRNVQAVEGVGVAQTDSDDDGIPNEKCDASYQILRQKYKLLKQNHYMVCQRYCDLEMKYDELVKTLKAIESAKSSSVDVTSDTADSDVMSLADDIFSAHQIKVLDGIDLEKKKDSTFILQCVEYAYKDCTSTLINKTLFGTLERTEFGNGGATVVRPAKDPLTPEKVKRIEHLFIRRVTKSKCLGSEFVERIKTTNINRLIGSAIRNVVSKEIPKTKSTQKNANLNL